MFYCHTSVVVGYAYKNQHFVLRFLTTLSVTEWLSMKIKKHNPYNLFHKFHHIPLKHKDFVMSHTHTHTLLRWKKKRNFVEMSYCECIYYMCI